jgi:D-alanyl-D-alanine carboxypeptidase (penicillin-binding protein 5/6)
MKKTNILLFLLAFFFTSNLCAEEIQSKAVVVLDGSSGNILYAKNPHLRLPPASTTKLISAMVVIDKINIDDVVTISKRAANTQSVAPRLKAGERYTARELLYLSLLRSINGAAVALAEAVAGSEEAFVFLMNEKASKLGLQNTAFINSSGLPGHGQHITAYELALIMKASLSYPTIKEILNTRTKDIYNSNGRRLFVKNTNNLLWKDDYIIGGKTGYTRAAGHCFVCAANKGDATLIVAILGETVREELWHDSYALLSKGHDILTMKAEPAIYFSEVREKPVVLASYKTKEFETSKKKKSAVKAKSKTKKSEKAAKKSRAKKQAVN